VEEESRGRERESVGWEEGERRRLGFGAGVGVLGGGGMVGGGGRKMPGGCLQKVIFLFFA
jgi:hypothetical protein